LKTKNYYDLMLCIYNYSSEKSKNDFFINHYRPENDLWVVGDLQTKRLMKNQLLTQHEFLSDNSLLRMSEFFKNLFLTQTNQYQIVSKEYLTCWISDHIIKNQPSESLMTGQQPAFFLDLIDQLSPLFFNQNGPDTLNKYFSENPEAKQNWQDWSEIAFSLFKIIFDHKKWMLPHWISSFLAYSDLEFNTTQLHALMPNLLGALWIDVGADLKQSEALTLNKLSKQIDIHIFRPTWSAEKKYDYLFKPYDDLQFTNTKNLDNRPNNNLGQSLSQSPDSNPNNNSDCNFDSIPDQSSNIIISNRNSAPTAEADATDATSTKSKSLLDQPNLIQTHQSLSQIGELKWLISQTRKLIESKNLSPHQIAWFFSDVEQVLPVLELLAKPEGLPLNRSGKSFYLDLPQVEKLFSFFNSLIGNHSFYNSEYIVSNIVNATTKASTAIPSPSMPSPPSTPTHRSSQSPSSSTPPLSFTSYLSNSAANQFRLKNVTHINEFPRSISTSQSSPEQMLSLLDFIQLIFDTTERLNLSEISSWAHWIGEKLFDLCDQNEPLSLKNWITLSRSLSAQHDLPLDGNTQEDGIQIFNYSESSHLLPPVVFIMGLTDSALKKKVHHYIKPNEFDKLGWNYGFFLDHPNYNVKESDISWLMANPFDQIYISTHSFNLESKPQAPHLLFLEQQTAQGHFINPPLAWDLGLSDNLSIFNPQVTDHQPYPLWPLTNTGHASTSNNEYSISVTNLEKYIKCPFSGNAKRLFQLSDEPYYDIDSNYRDDGSFHHLLVELYLKNQLYKYPLLPQNSTQKDSALNSNVELNDIFTQIAQTVHNQYYQKLDLDPSTRDTKLNQAIVFLKELHEFETAWQNQNPAVPTRSILSEVPFELWIDFDTQQILANPSSGSSVNALKIKGKIDRIDIYDNGFIIVDYKRKFKEDYQFNKWISHIFLQLGIYAFAVQNQVLKTPIPSYKCLGAQIIDYSNFQRGQGFLTQEAHSLFNDPPHSKKSKVFDDATIILTFNEIKDLLLKFGKLYSDGFYEPIVHKDFQDNCQTCFYNQLCHAPHLKGVNAL